MEDTETFDIAVFIHLAPMDSNLFRGEKKTSETQMYQTHI